MSTTYRFGKCKTCKGTGLVGDEVCFPCQGMGERPWTPEEIEAEERALRETNAALRDFTRRMLGGRR